MVNAFKKRLPIVCMLTVCELYLKIFFVYAVMDLYEGPAIIPSRQFNRPRWVLEQDEYGVGWILVMFSFNLHFSFDFLLFQYAIDFLHTTLLTFYTFSASVKMYFLFT